MLSHAIEYLTDEYTHRSESLKQSDPEVQAIQILMALNRNVYYESTEERLTSAEAMANANPTAIFVLQGDGTVQHWNTSAESLLRSNDGLIVDNNHLTATDPHISQVMGKLFREVASLSATPASSRPTHVFELPRSVDKRPLQAIVMRLPGPQNPHSSTSPLLLLVSDPEKTSMVSDEVLRTLYGLTPAEAEIANGLLMGYSTKMISKRRHVSVATIRQQIKSMLQKTGTARQSNMIRLLMALPQMPAQEE